MSATTMTVRVDDETVLTVSMSRATKRLLIASYRDGAVRSRHAYFASSGQARAAVVLALCVLDVERVTS